MGGWPAGAWVRGCVGAWVRGCVGACVGVCICGCVPFERAIDWTAGHLPSSEIKVHAPHKPQLLSSVRVHLLTPFLRCKKPPTNGETLATGVPLFRLTEESFGSCEEGVPLMPSKCLG